MLTVGSLFSGIGGIELGLERTKYFKTAWFVENNPFCQSILRKHWPDIPIYGDITKIEWRDMPLITMLTGGFPCQDASCANPHGKGIEGKRTGLWKEYAKAIGVLRPRYALIENVPGILGRGLNVVLADIAALGYDAEWVNLSAADVGALHRRERIFIVAYRHAERTVDWRAGEFANQGRLHALGDAGEGAEKEADLANSRLGFPDGRGDARQGGSVGQVPRGKNPERAAADPQFIGGRDDENPSEHQNQTRRQDRRQGTHEGVPMVQDEGRLVAHDFAERIQRFVQKKIQGKSSFSWCQNVRRVEDLSGRPDIPEPLFRGGRDGVPDWVDRIKALGNAVVPDCAEFVGEMIMEHDKRVFPWVASLMEANSLIVF